MPGLQLVNETPLPLVCFTREYLYLAAFLVALHRRQIAWMCEARVTNYRLTEADIHQIVNEMNQLFRQGVGVFKPEPSRQG